MKTLKRFTAILAVIVTVISCFAVMASAKNVCNSVGGKANDNGGNYDIFYVKTNDTKKHTVKMTMKKGRLQGTNGTLKILEKKWYGFYEIKVYGIKNDTEKQISKTNVKNKSSYTITLSGYKEYKIKVYNWKTETIGRVEKPFVSSWENDNPRWVVLPTWTVSKTSGITLCK